MIILLSGPINSRKTTVGRALAALLPGTAHLEVDLLRELVHFLPLEAAIPINLENADAVASNLARRGIGVVLTYPLGQGDYEYPLRALAESPTPIHTFIRSLSLEAALTDRGGRQLSDHERRRISEQYQDNRHRPVLWDTDRCYRTDTRGNGRNDRAAHPRSREYRWTFTHKLPATGQGMVA